MHEAHAPTLYTGLRVFASVSDLFQLKQRPCSIPVSTQDASIPPRFINSDFFRGEKMQFLKASRDFFSNSRMEKRCDYLFWGIYLLEEYLEYYSLAVKNFRGKTVYPVIIFPSLAVHPENRRDARRITIYFVYFTIIRLPRRRICRFLRHAARLNGLPRSNKREQCARDRCTDRDAIFAIIRPGEDDSILFFLSPLHPSETSKREIFSQNCESNCKLRKRVVELLEITSYVERWSFRWVWVSRVKLLREEEGRENLKVGSSPLRCDNFIYTLAFDQLSLSPVIYASSRKYESWKKEKKKIKFSRNWDTLPLVVSPYSNFTQRDTTPPL